MSESERTQQIRARVGFLGCGSSSCYIEKPSGQAVNGPCRCFESIDRKQVMRLKRAFSDVRAERDALREQLRALREALERIAATTRTPPYNAKIIARAALAGTVPLAQPEKPT